MNPILEIINLSKSYEKEPIIKNLNLQINKNESVCLFAPSGTGKTTLIKIINGIISEYNGRIKIDTSNISTVFQEPNLFWYKTVRENILLPFKLNNIDFNDEFEKIYQKWLKLTQLKNNENCYPLELSGGMQQKVALIRGFLLDPEFILLDEPFTSIDIRSKNKIIDFILHNYKNSTILFVTHNIDEVPKLSSKVIFFSKNMTSDYTEIDLQNYEKDSEIIKTIFEKIYQT